VKIWTKLCGFTLEEDVQAAVALEVDAIGFIFVAGSKRNVSTKTARILIRHIPARIIPVGVFVDSDHETILKTIETTGIRGVQLHGKETPEFVSSMTVPAIKAFRVGPGFLPSMADEYRGSRVLLDGFKEGMHGGTGVLVDWSIAAAIKSVPIILSGGLTPENVRDGIRAVRPFGVDVSSGIERSPGIKDRDRMSAFVAEVRSAESTM